jgi:hypothetical protein
VVAVAVAALAWFSQNRTLAAAAAALGLYALHLFSIRFLLDNQKRQQRVLDAQWEVLQRFIDTADLPSSEMEDLVPAMPVDRDAPERLVDVVPVQAPAPTVSPVTEPDSEPASTPPVVEIDPEPATEILQALEAPQTEIVRPDAEPVVRGEVVPPVESLGGTGSGFAFVVEEDAMRDEESYGEPVHQVPVPRHFALGTVALVRDLLSPAEVARVLLEQRKQPGKKFGGLAVEMGLLSDSQREELLLAQQEGLFTDAEMRDARQRLRQFRENAAHSMAGLD